MIGLFCFDGPLYKDKNGIYCNVTLTNEMFNRYFSVVDELIVVVRTFISDKTFKELNMKPLSTDKIRIVEVENFNTVSGFLTKRKKFEKEAKVYVAKADMIFARMPSNTSNSILKIARKLKKEYLVEVGGCAWDSYWNHGVMGKIIAPLMFYKERKYVKEAKFATYVTKEFLQKRYPSDGISTNCSNVYLQTVDSSVLQERIKKIEYCNLKKVILGQAVNSIDVKYKGEHLVIQAMAELKKKGIYIEYQIAGPGNGKFLVEQAERFGVSEQLNLIGTLKKEEIYLWYRNLDLYIQPSKQEGLPRSVIEAMSVGCPALGSNIAGIPELISKECLFSPRKNDQIVKSIENILNKKSMLEKARENFERAKEYNILDIEDRRKEIFLQYKSSVCRGERK